MDRCDPQYLVADLTTLRRHLESRHIVGHVTQIPHSDDLTAYLRVNIGNGHPIIILYPNSPRMSNNVLL